MVEKNQNFEIVRGTDVQQPFTVTLDQGRTLDGTETWKWECKANKTDASALITATDANSKISVDGTTFQPTLVLAPADTPTANFPLTNDPASFWHGLEMTKSSKVEAVLEGKMIVISDVAQ